MTENKFIVMVGFPGSGKSTYASKLAASENAVVFSSDALRKELYGSEAVQDRNEEVFNALMKRMIEALKAGESIVFDAMNISSKYRRSTLRMIDRYCAKKLAYLMATPFAECLARNAERDRHVPEDVIKRAYMNFNMPHKAEGFDDIVVVYPKDFSFRPVESIVEGMRRVDHENHHHALTVGDHMLTACNKYKEACDDGEYRYDQELAYAILAHDIGKPFAKTRINYKGEVCKECHYYNHANVGAYDILFTSIPEEMKINVALLIQYHMKYYDSWSQSEKAKRKDAKLLGDGLFNKLEILHKFDLEAH